MKVAATRKFKAKDGTYLLTAILESVTRPEELSDTSKVVVLARRDLVCLQRILASIQTKGNPELQDFKRKVSRYLDSLTRS